MQRIKINVADSVSLQQFYRVGPVLADRIVEHRLAHGPFTGPADLARVDGMSLDLATALAPQIDWLVDCEDVQPNRRRFLSVSVAILVVTPLLVYGGMETYKHFQQLLGGSTAEPVALWVNWSIGVTLIVGQGTLLSLFAKFFVVESKRSHAYLTRALIWGFGISVLAVISTGLGSAVYFSSVSPNGWGAFFRARNLAGLMSGICLMTFSLPVLIAYTSPQNAYSAFVARIFDVTLYIGGIINVALVLVVQDAPLWYSVYVLVVGLLLFGFGMQFVRGSSPYSLLLEEAQIYRADESPNVWVSWINSHLPDVDQQRALLAALQREYPPSRLRTWGGAALMGGAIWMIATTCAAIAEWIIQRFLDAHVPPPFP